MNEGVIWMHEDDRKLKTKKICLGTCPKKGMAASKRVFLHKTG
jgi:hypothetical protein